MAMINTTRLVALVFLLIIFGLSGSVRCQIEIGLVYPRTGPDSACGLDQWRSIHQAVREINQSGGILNEPAKVIWADSRSDSAAAVAGSIDLIDNRGADVVFCGGDVDIIKACDEVCRSRNMLFIGIPSHLLTVSSVEQHGTSFYTFHSPFGSLNSILEYIELNYVNPRICYVSAADFYGSGLEDFLRRMIRGDSSKRIYGLKVKSSDPAPLQIENAISSALASKPEAIILLLSDENLKIAIEAVSAIKTGQIDIFVPRMTLEIAEDIGPYSPHKIIATVPWCWNAAEFSGSEKGKDFIENFASRYHRYPGHTAAYCYVMLNEYKTAVEMAGSFATDRVAAFMRERYNTMFDSDGESGAFDWSIMLSRYLVEFRPANCILKDRYLMDYFKIVREIRETNVGAEVAGDEYHDDSRY
jgi:branched-chain amino acid transport system substrate-binding protein